VALRRGRQGRPLPDRGGGRRLLRAVLRWVLRWWQGQELALAVDATACGERVVALVVSVLYRGSAIPVAWHVVPANRAGVNWMPPILRLLDALAPAVPPEVTVVVLADRGLWSPRLWRRLRRLGWHPLLRVRNTTVFRPDGQRCQPARGLVPGPGHAWVGRGVAFSRREDRRRGTLLVVWDEGQAEPWVLLTDLPPEGVGVCWYGLRAWVELGFRALKGVGWHWERTRRTDPERVARHWLVLAVATLWTLAYGTRVEDAALRGVPPARLRAPAPAPAPPAEERRPRRFGVFLLGLARLRWQLLRGRPWRWLWLAPEPWPDPPPRLAIVRPPPAPGPPTPAYLPL